MMQKLLNNISSVALVLLATSTFVSCAQTENPKKNMQSKVSEKRIDTTIFATGCFWCTEAVFQQLKGVLKVTSGYTGGQTLNPTYKEVCSGETGHAECLQIVYDPLEISFDDLLEIFFQVHDPTSLNRQGGDVGTQYRSAVFYTSDEQKNKVLHYKEELDKSGAWNKPIVTEITKATVFYPAEDYHQNYYNNNVEIPYCQLVIKPKLDKFQKVFKDKLKNQYKSY